MKFTRMKTTKISDINPGLSHSLLNSTRVIRFSPFFLNFHSALEKRDEESCIPLIQGPNFMMDLCTQARVPVHRILTASTSSFSDMQIMLRLDFLHFNSSVNVSFLSTEQK